MMTSPHRLGETWIPPLPAFASLPALPPVSAIDPEAYTGAQPRALRQSRACRASASALLRGRPPPQSGDWRASASPPPRLRLASSVPLTTLSTLSLSPTGPTEESNWVIQGRLLVGAYPSSTNDAVNAGILSGILALGAGTFVCLQSEYQHEGVAEHEWRSGAKLRPYIFDAIRLVDDLPPSSFPGGVKPDGLEFVHFPIVDCAIANDASVTQLAHDLCARLNRSENLYVHW